ncbi:MAG TPA: hypothetical protein VF339_11535 [Gammaproteobacteria bacterium]
MAHTPSRNQVLLAKTAVALIVAGIVAGSLWYGFSSDVEQRIWRDLSERPGGPMTFRLILQPTMAALVAMRDGMEDARTGRSPYLWTLIASRQERGPRLREGLIATSRIILLGLIMDAVYQLTVLDTFFPGEAVIVALLLAFIPYLLLRGPFARISTWWHARHSR